jgi:hypothetical protein
MMAMQAADTSSTVRATSTRCPFWPSPAIITLNLQFQLPVFNLFYRDHAKQLATCMQTYLPFVVVETNTRPKRGPPDLLV